MEQNSTSDAREELRMRQQAFLAAYARLARINRAAEAAEVDRSAHYHWLREDPAYAEAFRQAKELATQQLEDEAVRRALDGWDEPMNVGGQVVMVRKFSDQVLIFLLKGNRPETYRERQSLEVTGKDGKPLVDIAAIDAIIANATKSE